MRGLLTSKNKLKNTNLQDISFKIEARFVKKMLSLRIVGGSFFSYLQQRYWKNRPKFEIQRLFFHRQGIAKPYEEAYMEYVPE